MREFDQQPGLGRANRPAPGHKPLIGRRQARVEPMTVRLAREIPSALLLSIAGATKFLLITAFAISLVVGGILFLFRSVDPPGSMLILTQRLQGIEIDRRWVALEEISPNLIRAVVASEDSRFCQHHGIDFTELEAALAKAEEAGDVIVRGASTITMQVAKNLFLSPARNLFRKGVEMGLALAIETTWPKRRILEIYLNIAEWGPGVFGAEAGAHYHFRKPAAELTPREAALMAVALPNPIVRKAGRPGPGLQRLATMIEARARRVASRIDCVRYWTRD